MILSFTENNKYNVTIYKILSQSNMVTEVAYKKFGYNFEVADKNLMNV